MAVIAALAMTLLGGGASAARPALVGPAPPPVAATEQAQGLGLAREVGQTLIATYAGARPPASLLADLRAGRFGGVILMGDNTPSLAAIRAATRQLQTAARSGGHPGVLIMTDQEGGEVQRLVGQPPVLSAHQMGRLALTRDGVAKLVHLGERTGQALAQVGIDLDLAPDADVVANSRNFIYTQGRSFGASPARVAQAACAFARGVAAAGVGFTLKHFPGLGDAGALSTDTAPVSIRLGAAQLSAGEAAYRSCGSAPLAAVMVSSASYPALTGHLPAVLSPVTYDSLLPGDGVHGLVISDSISSGALDHLSQVPVRALAAGLDMAMYPDAQADAERAYGSLLAAARRGRLSAARLQDAAAAVLAFKASLGLG